MPDEQRLPETRLLDMARRAAELVAAHQLNELTIEEDGLRVTVTGTADIPPFADIPASAVVAVPMHVPMLPEASSPRLFPPSEREKGNKKPLSLSEGGGVGEGVALVALESPMVGVFYHSPSPEDPPFVTVGDTITVGQTVGLIEAMKVYSELPSDVSGRVVRLAAENGALVQQGQPLLYVEPV